MARASQIPGATGKSVPQTPQNTPMTTTTPSALSRPHVPPTLEEDEDEDSIPTIMNAGASGAAGRRDLEALSSNPIFTEMVQGKLASLMGKSSGYIESLPPIVKQRIDGLKGIQEQQTKIEAEFQNEILALEKRFAERYAPLYDQRARIVAGSEEPTEELVTAGREADSDDEDEEAPAPPVTATSSDPKGIPQFWLTALQNHIGLSDLITEKDEEVLKHLTDVRVAYLDKPGFKIVFTFSEGASAYFKNKTLEKTYYYQSEVGYEGDFVYDHAEGTKIEWLPNKDLTMRTETKKQRNKNTGQTRVITKNIPQESFFSFFTPPKPPADEDDEDDEEEDIAEKLELDYQIGEDLKERIIPRAVDFFTGKALQYEQGLDGLSEGDFDDEDLSAEENSDQSDSEVGAPSGRQGLRAAARPPQSGITPTSAQDPQECKQQ